jgi:DcaP outer membrane protein
MNRTRRSIALLGRVVEGTRSLPSDSTVTTMQTRRRGATSLIFVLLLIVGIPRGTRAQSQDVAAKIDNLQKRLDALQSQMAEVQSELQALSPSAPAAKAISPSGAITEQAGSGTAGIEKELTPQKQQIGEATATYRTTAQDPVAAPRLNNEPLDPRYPGYFRLPGTNTLLRIGGYFKTDFIYDLKPAGNSDSFIPATIPIPQPTAVNNATVSIRPTRLNLDFLIPVESTSVRFFLEGDFFGSTSTTPRLRHAYAQVKDFLIGQSFSNFMDPDSGPDQLDFQGPNGQVSIRNPQFRYTRLIAEKTTFSLSAEKPTSDVAFKTPEFNALPNSPAPDGTLKIRREMDRGHVQLSALFRSVAVSLPDGRNESVFGWGFNFTGSEKVFGKDTFVYQAAYGNGIERYINDTSGLGIDAAVMSQQNPHIRTLPVFGAYGGYQHFWFSRLRSNAVYGFAQVADTGVQPGSTFHQSNYTAGNLIWNPFGSLNLGAEFLYGWRVNKDGTKGNAPRIMFSAKYNFVKTQAAN